VSYYLNIVTEPAVEPLSLDDAKTYARIDHDTEDATIERWIKTGREIAEAYQRKAYLTQTYDMIMDAWPVSPFDVPMAPLQSVTHIKYYGTDSTEYTFYDSETTSNVIIDTDSTPGRISLAYGIPWPSTVLRPIAGIKVRFISGYGSNEAAVPSAVRDAIALYCAWRNENRTAESGQAPKEFYDLLRPHRLRL